MTISRSYRIFPTGSKPFSKTPLKGEYKKEISTTPQLGRRKQNHSLEANFFPQKANTEDQGL
jgi:hypothetical protein